MSAIEAFRSLTLNLVLFLSLLISHHLGGGDYSLAAGLVPLFFLSFMLFWVRPLRTIEGPKLAAVLVIFQAIGHLSLDSENSVSTIRMSAAHLLAVFASYYLAKDLDRGLLALFNLLASLFVPTTFYLLEAVSITSASPFLRSSPYLSLDYLGQSLERGPPTHAIILDAAIPA